MKNNSPQIKNIISCFFTIISLYNNEEQKIIYIKLDNNKFSIEKANNIKECLYEKGKNENNEMNINNKEQEKKIIPVIEMLFKNYINAELNKGINKYFIILLFTNNKFSDLNNNEDDINDYSIFYKNYENIPFNFKIFNLGEEHYYNEYNNINMNIINTNNGNIKYERIMFQFYNLNSPIAKKEKSNKYLNDIPFLVEDFFEIQKSAKFSIFDE